MYYKPNWHMDIERFITFKQAFIIEGNIYDFFLYFKKDNAMEYANLERYLYNILTEEGYTNIIFYNHIEGFYNNFSSDKTIRSDIVNSYGKKNNINSAIDEIIQIIDNKQVPTAVIINHASRIISSPENISEEELYIFSKLHLSTLKPQQICYNNRLYNNLVFLIVNKINDLPAWFYIDNPYIKTIFIPKSDKKYRKVFIDNNIKSFMENRNYTEVEIEKYKQKFIDLTDGFNNIELKSLLKMCNKENITIENIEKAISLYKYGIKDNPWHDLNMYKLKEAESFIKERVKGQDIAVQQTLDVIKRAVSGLSGLQHSSSMSKPKGILFFAGPTGTGKTELAKTLANLLFGDDNACIRFDMSEFQQPHSDQKLLGAPPGYVGYESGGQLTNAVKEKPFSILLFDEIEKAHPSILDKFLQILEDGRMTDGKGETVYFSETLIIFTSNLGIYVKDSNGNKISNISPNMSYQDIKVRLIDAIKNYFNVQLGRPEILNRIGNNFIIFDYIRDDVCEMILNSQINKIKNKIKEIKNTDIEISETAYNQLLSMAKNNKDNGGRGIGNIVEKNFINPLARYIFDNNIQDYSIVRINSINSQNELIYLDCLVFSKMGGEV